MLYVCVYIIMKYLCMCSVAWTIACIEHFSDIERKKEVAKSKEQRKEIHNLINY